MSQLLHGPGYKNSSEGNDMEKIKLMLDRLIKSGIIKYGLVGVINTVVTAVVIFALMNVFGVSYRISNMAGYIAGFFNSFVLNKFWTFKGKQASTVRQFLRFTAVFAVCYLLQHGLLVILVEKLLLGQNLSTLIAMVFYTVLGFFFNKLFTFKK